MTILNIELRERALALVKSCHTILGHHAIASEIAATILRLLDENQSVLTRLATVLQDHYLYDIGCNHQTKTDTPICACMGMKPVAYSSVGAAVQGWIKHVQDILTNTP